MQQLKPRLLVVLGTPAFMAVAPVEKHTPVVFALVADPYFTGAAYEPEHPEDHQENLTGIASPAPLEAALQQGAGLLGQASWGLLYDPSDGVAAELAAGIHPESPAVRHHSPDRGQHRGGHRPPGLEAPLEPGGAGDLPPAGGQRRRATPPWCWTGAAACKVMVVSGYPEGSHQGALLWVALDYRRLGEETAALAQRVLNGEAPKKIPIAQATPLKVEVDEKLLRHWSGYPGKSSDQ